MRQPQKKQKTDKQDDDSYEAEILDNYDEQIEDDGNSYNHLGEQSSEHSSIDLQQYLKNRDNIPSDPSDLEDDDQEEDEDDQEQDEDKVEDSSESDKPQPTKKQRMNQKKQKKAQSESNDKKQTN